MALAYSVGIDRGIPYLARPELRHFSTGKQCRIPSRAKYNTMAADLRDVDLAELRLPSSRSFGADPVKLHRQIAKQWHVYRRDAASGCI
jgi:hypothetical protein